MARRSVWRRRRQLRVRSPASRGSIASWPAGWRRRSAYCRAASCSIRYTGRTSGLPRQLPVNCEPFEGGYLIRVGRSEQKNWWRNFTSPWAVELVRKGRRIRGSAVAVPGTTGSGQRIAADYFATHHGAAKRAGLPKMHKGELPTPGALQAAAATLVFVVVTPEK